MIRLLLLLAYIRVFRRGKPLTKGQCRTIYGWNGLPARRVYVDFTPENQQTHGGP